MIDIQHKTVKKFVEVEKVVNISVLTCRKCKKTEEIVGVVDSISLPSGWFSFTLESLGCGAVSEWLICGECAKAAKEAVGL